MKNILICAVAVIWSSVSGQHLPILTALATMRKETRLAAVPLTVNLL